MGARTLLYRLMVISPIALIAWIIGTGKFQYENFEFTACTRQQHDAISDYREAVAVTLPMTNRTYELNPQEVRYAASIWVEGAATGKLKPLTPVYVGDSVREGIKGQIRECESALAGQLRKLSEMEIRAGNYQAALSDLRLALLVSQVLRSSDPVAEAACCHEEGHILTLLENLLPKLSLDDVEGVHTDLVALRETAPSLESLVKQTNKLLRRDLLERPIEPTQFGELVAHAKVRTHAPLTLADLSVEPKETHRLSPYMTELYLGIRARSLSNAHYQRVIEKASVLLNPKKRTLSGTLANFSL